MKEFLLVSTILLCWQPYDCTLCWECTSLDDDWCSEHFVGKDLSPYSHRTVNCTGNCMKMIALAETNRKFYVRTCDVTGQSPQQCHTGSHVLGIPRSTICVCPTDRCNHASSHHIGRTDFLFTFIGMFVVTFWLKNT